MASGDAEALRKLVRRHGAKLIGFATAVALPMVLAGQTPQVPDQHAADTARAKVAEHRATHRRGEVVRSEAALNPNAATSAVRATSAAPSQGVGPAAPARPATPAVPATPGSKGGQSDNHRP